MPLADAIGVVALLQKDLGQETVLERDDAVGAGKSRRAFGDARHPVGMVVSACDAACARWRAHRRRMNVAVAESFIREGMEIVRADCADLPYKFDDVRLVQHDED